MGTPQDIPPELEAVINAQNDIEFLAALRVIHESQDVTATLSAFFGNIESGISMKGPAMMHQLSEDSVVLADCRAVVQPYLRQLFSAAQ